LGGVTNTLEEPSGGCDYDRNSQYTLWKAYTGTGKMYMVHPLVSVCIANRCSALSRW